MKRFRDLLGGELLNVSDIDDANTGQELYDIIEKHIAHVEGMALDTISGIERFRRSLNLDT